MAYEQSRKANHPKTKKTGFVPIVGTVLHEDTPVTNSGKVQRTKPLGEGKRTTTPYGFSSSDKSYNAGLS